MLESKGSSGQLRLNKKQHSNYLSSNTSSLKLFIGFVSKVFVWLYLDIKKHLDVIRSFPLDFQHVIGYCFYLGTHIML